MTMSGLSCWLFFLALCMGTACPAQNAQQLLDKGWEELVKDNDTTALRLFGDAYIQAVKESATEQKGLALLNMGICYYGITHTKALSYCLRAMDEFKKLEDTKPAKALEGRCRCLQLISTIKSRQGLYREAITLSKEAMAGFPAGKDTTGYLGLIYNSMGKNYLRLKMKDSSDYCHRRALEEHLRSNNLTYMPTAYLSVADIERGLNSKEKSLALYTMAYDIANNTGNRQAQVTVLIGFAEWYWTFGKQYAETEERLLKAEQIAATLTDKTFSLRVADKLLEFYKENNKYEQALRYREIAAAINDSLYSWDRKKEVKALEIQFDVAEKDRQLMLARKEKKIATLTNYFLWGGILVLVLASAGAILALRRIHKRDRQLLKTKEALVVATEEQKLLKEQQMQREIEFKESQLSALALQMLQKNELMQELKDKLEHDNSLNNDQSLNKLITKGLSQDKDWNDFNAYFESINKNFYIRLKEAYPDISPNDLKICALIKLNLSIKEMAGILNISPDSVKTARYRLRKKLQLNTEDNLVEFISML